MNTSQGLLLAIAWFLLRFGLPIFITGVVIYTFSQLDSRWKKEALSKTINRNKTGIVPLMKCWVFNDCPPELRENCSAYQEKYLPCWQVFRDDNDNLKEKCLGCAVFHNAPIPITENY